MISEKEDALAEMSLRDIKGDNGQKGAEVGCYDTVTEPSAEEINARLVYLGPKTKRYTLVFDLDETLVHAGPPTSTRTSEDKSQCYTVTVRFHALDMLRALSRMYELVIFTAANEDYARQVVSSLDPQSQYFSKLLTRKSCIVTKEGIVVKDLRIFADRSLDELLIVDDCVDVFTFQPDNGIPVTPFFGAPDDRELLNLLAYLTHLYTVDNIVAYNRSVFQLSA